LCHEFSPLDTFVRHFRRYFDRAFSKDRSRTGPGGIAGGEIEYQRYCATCHGVNGKGRGPMARFLTIEPSDLTRLAKRNGNKFDFWQVYRTIDGREQMRAHGTREMPVWGTRFQAEAKGYDQVSRAEVAGRILGLTFYLQYIQER
jgi:Cytochrome C oxidase, cbb3-type, subunit III